MVIIWSQNQLKIPASFAKQDDNVLPCMITANAVCQGKARGAGPVGQARAGPIIWS